jgi:hypothetical protein
MQTYRDQAKGEERMSTLREAAQQALTAQRSSDTLTDAWTVFNRVQENVHHG